MTFEGCFDSEDFLIVSMQFCYWFFNVSNVIYVRNYKYDLSCIYYHLVFRESSQPSILFLRSYSYYQNANITLYIVKKNFLFMSSTSSTHTLPISKNIEIVYYGNKIAAKMPLYNTNLSKIVITIEYNSDRIGVSFIIKN